MSRPKGYGMSAQVAAKIGAKRDAEQEQQGQAWIEELIKEPFPSADYADSLKDGIIVCKLANALQPGVIKKINTDKGKPFKLRENIDNFQRFAKGYGVPETDVFQVVDLYEKANIAQVTQCIFAVARLAQTKPEFTGPGLGPKQSLENKREWTEEQLQEQKAMKAEIGLQMGSNKGASQAGQNFGLGRQINYKDPTN